MTVDIEAPVLARESGESGSHGIPIVECRRSLDDLVKEIETRSLKGDDRLIFVAMLVREVKQRVEAGEAGPGVKWLAWANEHFRIQKTRIYELIQIASASDPKRALDDYRFRAAERQKTRQQRIIERNPERAEVVRLIRAVNIEIVRKVRKYLAALGADNFIQTPPSRSRLPRRR